ncbi:hypothetical protein CA11_22170 [Gimesia maris]|nr:hypothetical protein CA11_22170 [Gimesia maris]
MFSDHCWRANSATRWLGTHTPLLLNIHLPSPVPILIILSVSLLVFFGGWWGWLSVEAQEFVQAFAGVELFAGACFGVRDDVLVEVY